MWACENGHQDVVQLLLNHQDLNIDLKEKDNFGVTGFMKACKSGFKDVVKMLLNHLDHIEQINSGWTIFYTDVGEHYMLSKEIRNLIEMYLSKPWDLSWIFQTLWCWPCWANTFLIIIWKKKVSLLLFPKIVADHAYMCDKKSVDEGRPSLAEPSLCFRSIMVVAPFSTKVEEAKRKKGRQPFL